MKADLAPTTIDLAQEPAFSLGAIEVRPATLEVIAGDRREQLEPRIMQVLAALARRRGEVVSRDELVASCWGGRIVGDDAIHRCIFRLRKLAEALGGFTIDTVPRVGFRLSESQPASGRARRLRVGWPLAALVVLLIAGAAGFGLLAWRNALPLGGEHEPRVAFLAFEPLNADPQTLAFARGLTDEVVAVLNENAVGLGAPTPSRAAPDADLVVGGAVKRDGEAVRVRAYLEAGRSRVTLWSKQYEGTTTAENALGTEIAVALSDNLLTALEPRLQKGLNLDDRTLALWVTAAAAYRQGAVPGDFRVATRAWEQIVERAPRFAEARGLMAASLANASRSAPAQEALELRRRARAEAERAIRSDPTTTPAGYDALYWLARLEAPDDIARAEDILAQSISHVRYIGGGLVRRCQLLLDVGRAKAAVPYCERAVALRPLGAPWGYRYAWALAAAGETERAQQVMDREVRLHPQLWWIRRADFDLRVFEGSPNEAIARLRETRPGLGFKPAATNALEAFLRARKSRAPADIDEALAKLRAAAASQDIEPRYLFVALVAFGRLDEAFAAAQPIGPESIANGSPGWLFEPGMDALHRDPRFWPLAKRAGLIRYWQTRGVWPDFCSDRAVGIDCPRAAAAAGV